MSTNPLLTPLQLGALTLPNRVLMAPLTRCRATRDHVPTPHSWSNTTRSAPAPVCSSPKPP